MVDRWKPSEQEHSGREASAAREDGLRLLDPGRIEMLRGLGALSEVVRLFLEDAPPLFEKLRLALEAGELETAQETVHRLKGSTANLGAAAISESFRNLELVAKQGDLQTCRDRLAGVEAELQELQEALAELLAREAGR